MSDRFLKFRNLVFQAIALLLLWHFFANPVFSQNVFADYEKLWNDPKLEKLIDNNIETFRKGDAIIQVLTENGKPLTGAKIEIKQKDHEFLFGCNLFYLKGFETEEENEKYESLFLKLFNFGSAPFYWSDLEPEPGKIRFAKDSEKIHRRPAPDVLLEFARKHHIQLKGHPLIWFAFYPEWLPKDEGKVEEAMVKHISEIGQRYSKEIKIWDVVNESLCRPGNGEGKWANSLPRDYVAKSFQMADKAFAPDNTLMINEVPSVSHRYHREESPYYLQISNLILRNIRLDGIGFQFHIMSKEGFQSVIEGHSYNPKLLSNVYNLYSEFNLPLYITETTIPTFEEFGGQKMQAKVVRNFYRFWFSVPKMAGITWWNLGDGTAIRWNDGRDENRAFGGLLDDNLNPKESYHVLDQLINHDWNTNIYGNISIDGTFSFRGFYGKYLVKVIDGRKVKEFEINLTKNGPIHFELKF